MLQGYQFAPVEAISISRRRLSSGGGGSNAPARSSSPSPSRAAGLAGLALALSLMSQPFGHVIQKGGGTNKQTDTRRSISRLCQLLPISQPAGFLGIFFFVSSLLAVAVAVVVAIATSAGETISCHRTNEHTNLTQTALF